jgi:hypothetical protein
VRESESFEKRLPGAAGIGETLLLAPGRVRELARTLPRDCIHRTELFESRAASNV